MPQLQTLDPRLPIHAQIPLAAFTMQNTPVAQDTSAHTHALALEAALGGPDLMAARVGACAHASLLAAQLLRVREAWPEVWARTGKVQVASSFVASLFCGAYVNMGEAEACATGLWAHSGPQPAGTPSHWDEGVLEIVGGSRDEGRRIWGWLGDVDISGGRRRIGIVSRYLVERYGFDPGAYRPPRSSQLTLTTGLGRDYRHAFHVRLPLNIPLAVPHTLRHCALLRSHGCIARTGN